MKFFSLSVFTVLSTRMKQLAILLNDFNFECIGTAQTDDENVICESLKRFGAIIGTIEDEREKMVSWNTLIYIYSILYNYGAHSSLSPTNTLLNRWRIFARNKSAALRRTKRSLIRRQKSSVSRRNVSSICQPKSQRIRYKRWVKMKRRTTI